MRQQRNINLDLLRTIGLLGIILAHVSPPDRVLQIRTFDVPLMVIVSGIAFEISYNCNTSTAIYYRQRIIRLLAPTWTFLVIFFTYFWFVDLLTNDQYISLKIIINKGC